MRCSGKKLQNATFLGLGRKPKSDVLRARQLELEQKTQGSDVNSGSRITKKVCTVQITAVLENGSENDLLIPKSSFTVSDVDLKRFVRTPKPKLQNKNILSSTTCGEELQKIFKDWQSFKGLCLKGPKKFTDYNC